MSKMLPALQNDPTVEWVSFRSDNDAVVFAPIPGVCFAPVQLQAVEFQCIEGDEQVLRPLETVAAFPEAPVHEEVIENWRAEHVVLFSELADGGVSALCQQPCFFSIHPRRKGRELARQRFGRGRIIFWDLE